MDVQYSTFLTLYFSPPTILTLPYPLEYRFIDLSAYYLLANSPSLHRLNPLDSTGATTQTSGSVRVQGFPRCGPDLKRLGYLVPSSYCISHPPSTTHPSTIHPSIHRIASHPTFCREFIPSSLQFFYQTPLVTRPINSQVASGSSSVFLLFFCPTLHLSLCLSLPPIL